jgi:hypothetical protein
MNFARACWLRLKTKPKLETFLANTPLFTHKQLELAFIDQIVIECLSEHVNEFLATTPISNGKLPCDLMLAESSQAKKTKRACGTPAWTQGHPFNKALESSRTDLYKRWSGRDTKQRKTVFAAVCPDIALFAPFRVVLECKYFNKPGNQTAASQLVNGLYQTLFIERCPRNLRERQG